MRFSHYLKSVLFHIGAEVIFSVHHWDRHRQQKHHHITIITTTTTTDTNTTNTTT
jgi:hypothetical protein